MESLGLIYDAGDFIIAGRGPWNACSQFIKALYLPPHVDYKIIDLNEDTFWRDLATWFRELRLNDELAEHLAQDLFVWLVNNL